MRLGEYVVERSRRSREMRRRSDESARTGDREEQTQHDWRNVAAIVTVAILSKR